MKKRQKNSTGASALQINLSVALTLVSAILTNIADDQTINVRLNASTSRIICL